MKTDSSGDTLWTKTYENGSYLHSVQQTSDGGYITVGATKHTTNNFDVWLVKTDSQGDMIWDKMFGTSEYNETGIDIIETSKGGFIMLGVKQLYGSLWNPNSVWLIRIDSNGNIIWDKTYSKEDRGCSGCSIQELDDGGYIIAGSIRTTDIHYDSDIYLLKINSEGILLWEKSYDKNEAEYGVSVDKTPDDGFIILGNTYENDPLWYDIWLIKTDSDGELLWDTTFGGNNYDWGNSLQQTSDGGYIIAGYMYKIFGTCGFLIKTNNEGEKEWIKTYDKSRSDIINSVQQTSDGGYILTGYVDSSLILNTDVWLIKTDSNGNVKRNKEIYNILFLWFLERFPILNRLLNLLVN